MKYKLLLGMFLVCMPGILGFNCSYFHNITLYDECVLLNNTKTAASLVYTNYSIPDYSKISSYNINSIYFDNVSSGVIIGNAGIVSVNPSIIYQNVTLVPNDIEVISVNNYNVILPDNFYSSKIRWHQTCKILHFISDKSNSTKWFINKQYAGDGSRINLTIVHESNISMIFNVRVTIRTDYYSGNNCYDYVCKCNYKDSTYNNSELSIVDDKIVSYVNTNIYNNATISGIYDNTTSVWIDGSNSFILSIGNSSLTVWRYYYNPIFLANGILALEALQSHNVIISGGYFSNNTFYAPSNNCSITTYNFFNSTTIPCSTNISSVAPQLFNPKVPNLSILVMLILFIMIIYIIYRIVDYYWGKFLILFLILVPSVSATDCGLSNLASCIPLTIYNSFISLINAPLTPLLNLFENLLSSAPDISLFSVVWAIIIYCLSIFYCFLIMYAGAQFIIFGSDIARREAAKSWIRNTIIMIVLIQASYYLYELFLEVSATFTSGLLSITNQTFFQLTANNISNIGLQLIFTLAYVLALIIAILFLTVRYVMVAIGVIFVPIGIFCYFVPPLRSYGKLILHLIGMLVFVTVIDAIIVLACSMMLTIPFFTDIQILLMITCIIIINILFVILTIHIIHKSGIDDTSGRIGAAIRYVGMIG